MSGLVGHVMYAVLGAKAAEHRKLPLASVIHRHFATYLAGSYLGCDIQTLPEAVCIDTGQEVGYGTVPIEKSPLTGGAVRPWFIELEAKRYTARDVHSLFYGRAHVVFGFSRGERELAVPWDHLPDYAALACRDARELFGPGERPLAYALGWLAHIVGDCLIKSVQPGVDLNLLDGKYTPKNRPIQDLVTFHEIGRRELKLDWEALFADLVATPVEPCQLHYMRVAEQEGSLAGDFRDGWTPDEVSLLTKVLGENRRYLRTLIGRWLDELALRKEGRGWACSEEMSRQSGGLSYTDMVAAAEKANFRHALWQIGEAVADLFEAVVRRVPSLADSIASDGPTWSELTDRWKLKIAK